MKTTLRVTAFIFLFTTISLQAQKNKKQKYCYGKTNYLSI
jgi:hypothetical protein